MKNIPLHEHVAILIDADNVGLSYAEQVIKLSEYYGELSVCHAYGDWKKLQLSGWCEAMDALKIERKQVDRVKKNATDDYLKMGAAELLGNNVGGDSIDVFMIISGDGHFTTACNFLKERGKQVIVLSNRKQASRILQQACDKFYALEDLEQELSNLEELYSIAPREVRAFSLPLFLAYHQLIDKKWVWVSYNQLEEKLREIVADFENEFGKYELSAWLKNFDKDFESRDRMIRRIDPYPEATKRGLLISAYFETYQPDGLANLGEFGKTLRRLDPDYEGHFGSKKLSKLLEAYPDTFRIRENDVVLAIYWSRYWKD